MAFNGTLIAVGSPAVAFPMEYIRHETYEVSPNQRLELSAKSVSTGELKRKTAPHTRTKIEFETPIMWNDQMDALMTLLRSKMTDTHRRDIMVTYFDTETNTHKSGLCYMPDVKLKINHIEGTRIQYEQTRFAFIEY